MFRYVLVATLTGACRLGFDDTVGDAAVFIDDSIETTAKPDSSIIDADPTQDSPLGFGTYDVSETTVPYVAQAGVAVPGFSINSDDEGFVLALPFPFVFYGISYTEVVASTNGFLTFGTPPGGADSYGNDCPFNGTAPDAMIAVFWDDLYAPDAAPLGAVTSLAEGTAPDRRFTVEWKNLDAFYQAGAGNNSFGQGLRVTHKVTLFESGAIEMHYGPRTAPSQDRDCGLERHAGCSATVGLEAPGGTTMTTVQCGTMAGPGPGYRPITEGRLIRFAPL